MGEEWAEYLRRMERVSARLGVPSIEYEDGLVLYSTLFPLIAGASGAVVVDAGAGAGYSTAWLLWAMASGCRERCRLVGVEIDPFLASEAEKLLGEAPPHPSVEVEVVAGDALDYLWRAEPGSLWYVFVDIGKDDYVEALEVLEKALKPRGIAVFHNAFFPRPPREFFEKASREPWISSIVATRLGVLVAVKKG